MAIAFAATDRGRLLGGDIKPPRFCRADLVLENHGYQAIEKDATIANRLTSTVGGYSMRAISAGAPYHMKRRRFGHLGGRAAFLVDGIFNLASRSTAPKLDTPWTALYVTLGISGSVFVSGFDNTDGEPQPFSIRFTNTGASLQALLQVLGDLGNAAALGHSYLNDFARHYDVAVWVIGCTAPGTSPHTLRLASNQRGEVIDITVYNKGYNPYTDNATGNITDGLEHLETGHGNVQQAIIYRALFKSSALYTAQQFALLRDWGCRLVGLPAIGYKRHFTAGEPSRTGMVAFYDMVSGVTTSPPRVGDRCVSFKHATFGSDSALADTRDPTVVSGKGLSFNSDYLKISPGYNYNDKDVTFHVVIKATSNTQGVVYSGFAGPAAYTGLEIGRGVDGTDGRIQYFTSRTGVWAKSTSVVPLDQYHMISIVADTTSVRFYLDGAPDGSVAGDHRPGSNSAAAAFIGMRGHEDVLPYVGEINDFIARDYAQTDAQVAAEYTEVKARMAARSITLP